MDFQELLRVIFSRFFMKNYFYSFVHIQNKYPFLSNLIFRCCVYHKLCTVRNVHFVLSRPETAP
jgi:hypothetical protein